MKFDELIVLLPCHSLEDFPTHYRGPDAEGLLAAWSAPWHPALILASGKVPTWCQADSPPDIAPGRLFLVPRAAEPMVPAQFLSDANVGVAPVLMNMHDRPSLVSAALALVDSDVTIVAPDLVADFHALGTTYLQTELLTRRMRYLSHLDDCAFQGAAVEAAASAMRGDEAAARDSLAKCFSLLAEARAHFYPVDAYLLDFTLVATSTMGDGLLKAISSGRPISLLMPGEVVEQMARDRPDTLAALRQALEAGTVSLVGGEFNEAELPLLTAEGIRGEIERGLAAYQQHLGRRPTVFGRRRFGLTPVLPQILIKFGFMAAVHSTLEEGRLPPPERSKIFWEGLDGSGIDALGRPPLDARNADAFLSLPETLGTTMDLDHVATVAFAHWPGAASPWYDDLLRAAAYAPVLGKFVTLDEYFRATESSESRTRFEPDEYRAPYLRQAVAKNEADPVSRTVHYHRAHAIADAAQSLATLGAVLGGQPRWSAIRLPGTVQQRAVKRDPGRDDIEHHLSAELKDSTSDLARVIPREKSSGQSGYLVFNPLSFDRRIAVDAPELPELPTVEGEVLGVDESRGRKRVFLEVPAMGFAWFGGGKSSTAKKPRPKKLKSVADERLLRNEFLEVLVHPTTGGIQAIRDLGRRGNRLSQQLALRLPAEKATGDSDAAGEEAFYSTMVADSIDVTAAGMYFGEVTSRGRLTDAAGHAVAAFRQAVGLWRESRVLSLDIELETAEPLGANPWESYFAARFAWSDEAAQLSRGVQQVRYPTDAMRIEAPHAIEIQTEERRTTILTGGLPWHRRIGMRKFDTILVTRGETGRKFSLAVGLDLANPLATALDWITPPTVVSNVGPPTPNRSGWLFHLSRRNVVATHWEPLLDGDRAVGIRVRLLETDGRPGSVALRTFRPPDSARLLDFQSQPQADLQVSGDQVKLDFSAYEWLDVEVRWG